MFGSGQEYATSAAAFSNQFIELYTTAMGDWAYFIIAICAFTTMFSTTLTVTDSYPRVVNHIIHIRKGSDVRTESFSKMYSYLLVGISAGTLLLLGVLGGGLSVFIDLVITVYFLM